jgi:formylglycine-generating enzyme required for sulfatase activity
MALIPAGTFTMGDSLDGSADAVPVSTTVSAFYMDVTEVTLSQWQAVYFWAKDNGYSDLPVGSGKGPNHPVHSVSWYQVVKWCNARSQQAGLTPVYYTDDAQTTIYKTGNVDVTNTQVKWTANGYRLPTEAEWEKSARGGLNGQRFPWGNTITQNLANYYGNTPTYSYDLGPDGYHPTYVVSGTSPVGSFASNGYGLHDMSGNAWEWCWDWYDTPYSGGTDPRGATLGALRVIRGGSWYDAASRCCAAFRNPYGSPGGEYGGVGFRLARHQLAIVPTVPIVATGTATVGAAFDTFTVSGEVTTDEGTTVTRRGIVYGLTATPTLGTATDASATGTGTGAFSSILTGLSPETTYYARAYATSTVGTGYGADITFNTVSSTPVGFALISAGVFTMGDSFGEGDADERPLRQVTVSAFYIAHQKTTKALWDVVRAWGVSRGYTDLPVGSGKASNHPVQTVNWFDVIKWCNARSEKEGLTPVYYTDDAQTTTYKTGDVDVTNAQVKWTANGYRLPTEAEWEKAARGGLSGQRFPWGNAINQNLANYTGVTTTYNFDFGPNGYNAAGSVGGTPYTTSVGSFAANGYGLHDVAGNLLEWCWDWYGATYVGGTDPRGSTSGAGRVTRGGSWIIDAYWCCAATRRSYHKDSAVTDLGSRVLRSSVP